jgi:hypothetical protein
MSVSPVAFGKDSSIEPAWQVLNNMKVSNGGHFSHHRALGKLFEWTQEFVSYVQAVSPREVFYKKEVEIFLLVSPSLAVGGMIAWENNRVLYLGLNRWTEPNEQGNRLLKSAYEENTGALKVHFLREKEAHHYQGQTVDLGTGDADLEHGFGWFHPRLRSDSVKARAGTPCTESAGSPRFGSETPSSFGSLSLPSSGSASSLPPPSPVPFTGAAARVGSEVPLFAIPESVQSPAPSEEEAAALPGKEQSAPPTLLDKGAFAMSSSAPAGYPAH